MHAAIYQIVHLVQLAKFFSSYLKRMDKPCVNDHAYYDTMFMSTANVFL